MKLAEYRKRMPAVNAALTAALKAHGLNVMKLNTGVDELAGTVRLTIEAADADLKDATGKPTTPEAERYKQFCEAFGLERSWLGKEYDGHRLLGLSDRRGRANVVVLRVADGKRLLTDADSVRRRLGAGERRASAG